MKVLLYMGGRRIRGNEVQSLLIVEGLVQRGHDVIVSCRERSAVNDAALKAGARTTARRPRGEFNPVTTAAFANLLRKEKPHAVLLTSWLAAFAASAACRLARVPNTALRVGSVPRIHKWTQRYALRSGIDRIIVNSSDVRDHFLEYVGNDASRIALIFNGVRIGNAQTLPLAERFQIPADHTVVVGVGGYEKRKGFDLLLEALAMTSPDVHAVLVGDGAAERKEELESLARSLEVSGRVHFAGAVDGVAAIAGSDISVTASQSEGMSVAMLEAMALGKPAISVEVPGAHDALGEHSGRNAAGWICKRTADALGATIEDVARAKRNNPLLVKARVDEALWRANNWFAVHRMCDDYERVLSEAPHRR